MDYENSEESSSNGNSSEVQKKSCRGVTVMHGIQLLRAKGERIYVGFSKNGQAIGKNGAKYRSYLGFLTRSKVPLHIESWNKVPVDIKECIWEDLLTVFEGIKDRKIKELSTASNMWRYFKSLVYKNVQQGVDVLQKYPYLKEEWLKLFLASRRTPEFLEYSKKQKQRRAHHEYPHTMSRGGYAKLEDSLIKQKLEELRKNTSSSSTTEVSLSSIEIPRHVKWKEGRKKKTGTIVNEKTATVIEKIVELEEKVSEKSFVSIGRSDILTMALGNSERSGRVRGVGGNVACKDIFGRSSAPRYTLDEVNDMIKIEVQQRLEPQLEEIRMLKDKLNLIMQQMGHEPPPMPSTSHKSVEVEMNTSVPYHSAHGSSREDMGAFDVLDLDPFLSVPDVGRECLVLGPTQNEVARGRVYPQLPSAEPVPTDHMTVTVEVSLDDNLPIPMPDDEAKELADVVGGFTYWPKHLIKLLSSEGVSKGSDKTNGSTIKPKDPKCSPCMDPSSLPSKECKTLYKYAMKMEQEETIQVAVKAEIMFQKYDLYVFKDDILQLLAMEELNTSCIELYMLYLQSLCAQKNLSDYYGFVCPSLTWSKKCRTDLEKSKYFETCFKGGKKCLLAPHIDNDKKHWSLAAIYPDDNRVYWFDSLVLNVHSHFKAAIVSGHKMHFLTGGGAIVTKRKQTKWVKVVCHRQPTNKECGYYVLRYMSNIINNGRVTDPTKIFEEERPYTQEELDETRCQWADYLWDKM